MEIAVKLTLKLDTNEYEVNLALPNGEMTDEAPFKFAVEQVLFKTPTPQQKADKTYKPEPSGTKDTLLQVAVGKGESVYVAVQPPQNLLVTAGVGDIVKDLKVMVANGNTFDDVSKTFKKKTGKAVEGKPGTGTPALQNPAQNGTGTPALGEPLQDESGEQ